MNVLALRLAAALVVALLIPIPASTQQSTPTSPQEPSGRVRTGLDVLLQNPEPLRGKRIGLITNPSGVDADLRSTIDLLAARHDIHLVTLFGPEHGVRGDAGGAVSSGIDQKTGLPVYSLFGQTRRPTPAMLRGLDALVFDIQDVGSRFYTYVSTMALAMQQAAASGVLFVVLDRPNPLGGQVVAGPVLETQWSSFIGMYPLPILHGMTVGELAGMFNGEFGIGARLLVVRMEGWHRSTGFDGTGLPWVMTSPGIPRFETAVLYPAMGPIGDTNLDVGVLTPKPFEFVGGEFIQPWRLHSALEARHIAGVAFREVSWRGTPWTPTGGPEFHGVEIRVADRSAFHPMDLMLHTLDTVRKLYPGQFKWGDRSGSGFVFDLDMGTDKVRRAIIAGKSPDQIEQEWEPALVRFQQIREKYLLYH